jgi:hypothetical protein
MLTNNPRIVTDGLQFCVDAASASCYAGSGSTVTDEAGAVAGTKGSSVNYVDTNAGKSFDFTQNTSTNNLIRFTGSSSTQFEFSAQTVCTWLKTTTTKMNMDFVTGTKDTDTSDRWRHQTTNTQGGAKGIELDWLDQGSWGSFSYSTINYDDGDWHYFVTQFDDTTTTAKLYWDNVYYAYSASSFTDWTTGHGINQINVGGDAGELGSNFIGQMSVVQIYNRILSAAELDQNFQVHRSRFGI